MSWERLQAEINKVSKLFDTQKVNFQEYIEHPKQLLSLSTQFSPLKVCGKKNNFSIEAPTSGESSPCLSESGKTPRYTAPAVTDLHQLINKDKFTELDYDIEKYCDSTEKDSTLLIVIEGLDESVTVETFYSLLSDVKVNNYNYNDIFDSRNPKFINFKDKKCLSLRVKLKWPKLFARFIRKLQMHIKTVTGHAVKIGEAKLQLTPKALSKISSFNGVVFRNLPPKATGDELLKEISQNIQGEISVSSVHQLKEANCCVVECNYLEDAEIICKKMNKRNWQNPETDQTHTIKAHIYPYNTLQHKQREKSQFSDIFTIKPVLKPKSAAKPNNLKKTEIRRLIDIFASSDKFTQEPPHLNLGNKSFSCHNFESHNDQDKLKSFKSFLLKLT